MTPDDIQFLLSTLEQVKSIPNNSGSGDDGKQKCWTCNSVDHIAANCPKKDSSEQGNGWRTKGPKEGEKHVKLHKDKLFFWCPQCRQGKGFWTQTHRKHGGETLTAPQIQKAKDEFKTKGTVLEVLLTEAQPLDSSEGLSC